MTKHQISRIQKKYFGFHTEKTTHYEDSEKEKDNDSEVISKYILLPLIKREEDGNSKSAAKIDLSEKMSKRRKNTGPGCCQCKLVMCLD